jgi:hypothetical protein
MSIREPVDSLAAWTGPTIDYRTEGLHVLTVAEVDEIDAALLHQRSLGAMDFSAISTESFPLPKFRAFLRDQLHALRYGRGFLLLRGLPRERYSADDMAQIYFGLGVHLGAPIPQSWQGELLGHVIDIADLQDGVRGYNAGGGQRMHTDSCDIVGLMCLRAARSGGASRIASAIAVHNHMAAHCPDLLDALYDGLVFRRTERDAAFGTGIAVRPISVYERAGAEVTCYISGNYPMKAVEAGDAVLTDRQREALDTFHTLSSSPQFYLDMSIGEGDIQFLNNRLLVHGRTDYQDYPEIARRRHLLRLWLRVPSWPPLSTRQAMHTDDDHHLWLRQRRPFMEAPSTFLSRMTEQQALRKSDTAIMQASDG